MIEAPEALILAMQLNETVRGKTINYVIAAQTPHKFTWYHDSPESYPDKLTGKIVGNCTASVSYTHLTLPTILLV